MKVCHYNNNQAGVVVGDKVINFGDALIKAGLARQGYTMLEIIDALANNPAAMQIAHDAANGSGGVDLKSVKLLAPIQNPGTLWAAAANYGAHRAEMVDRMGSANKQIINKDDLMAEFFIKTSSSIIGPGDTILLPKMSKLVDFECELCAVIGPKARKVSEADSLNHVFGYMMCWDISQRDPWGKGMHNTRNMRKGFDTFTGLGPWIVTRDEIDEPQNLSITVLQNGKEAMIAHTSDMICGLREHIRFLSNCVTLRTGDCITTGTPAGVSKLHDGDKLHGTIEKIGSMELNVKDEASLDSVALTLALSQREREPAAIEDFEELNYPAAPKANPPIRTLLGPGPSPVSQRVRDALALPVVGHLDPKFLEIMDQNMAMLRELFQTQNRIAIPMSGTGSAGMETCFVNLIEPNDRVLIGVNGVFGTRMVDVAQRCGATVDTVDAEWGTALDAQKVKDALAKNKYKLVAVVHAETSTGVLQPMDDIAKLVRASGALLVVDAVTSLGGAPVRVDELAIDACYSGTQKCLGCPPGLSPVTFNERAIEVIRRRKTKVQSWYLDLSMIEKYWGSERVYHHTAPISMNYALHEALRIILEEGLEKSWQRHKQTHDVFIREMRKLEIEPAVAEAIRAPMINAIKIPEGADDAKVRARLYDEFDIEIGAGLGPLKGKVWRVGLMGHGSRVENVDTLAKALKQLI